jgi:hypothetical protein
MWRGSHSNGKKISTRRNSKNRFTRKIMSYHAKTNSESIDGLQGQINRIERILLVSAGALFSGMAGIILVFYKNYINQFWFPTLQHKKSI